MVPKYKLKIELSWPIHLIISFVGLTIASFAGEIAKQKTFHCIIEVPQGLFTDLFSGL
jgi:hypothetical protein